MYHLHHVSKIMLILLSLLALGNATSQACTGKDDHLPHATKLEVVHSTPSAVTIRVLKPYRITRYGGGAPGKVYYSQGKNPAKICADLVFSWEHAPGMTVADQSKWTQVVNGRSAARFEYIKKSARYERLNLPAALSEVYFHTLYSMKDDDYDHFTKNPKLAPRFNLVSVDCRVQF